MNRLLIIIYSILLCTSCTNNSDQPSMHYKNGQLFVEASFGDTGKNGKWVYFDINGDTLKIEKYKDNTIYEVISFDDNIRITSMQYEQMQLIEKTFLKPNNKYLTYFYSGEKFLISKSNHSNEGPYGEYIQYYQNGSMAIYTQDIKNGIFHYFDSLGNPTYNIQVVNFEHKDTLKVW